MSAASLARSQLLNGLAVASSLFLVAAGLTLIFGVTRIVNFAHGSLYMLGAYLAYTLIVAARSAAAPLGFWGGGAARGARRRGCIGALIERLLLRRLYAAPELLQLTATFGVVLIVRDAALALWGAEDLLGPRAPGFAGAVRSFGRAMPAIRPVPDRRRPAGAGRADAGCSRARASACWSARRPRTACSPAALGIDERALFTAVFALGAFLAGLAGALQLPREPANLGMDLAIDRRRVRRHRRRRPGLDSRRVRRRAAHRPRQGAVHRARHRVDVAGIAIAFPKLTLVAEFVVMAVVLAVRPQGLLGHAPQRRRRPRRCPSSARWSCRRDDATRIALRCRRARPRCRALPLAGDEYALVLATDILIAALFAASLQFLIGTGGMTSFGHAAYFGIGAYAAALARQGAAGRFVAALVLAPLAARVGGARVRLVLRAPVGRLSRDADARVRADRLVDRVPVGRVTGGSNGLVGVWPPRMARDRARAYYCVRAGRRRRRRSPRSSSIAHAPFGYALRAARDSPLRAAALGIDVRARNGRRFALAGAFAGLAGGLFAFSKGSISPETLAIPRSVDALVMVLLGGLNALFGPLLGAAAFTWLQDTLARAHRILARGARRR